MVKRSWKEIDSFVNAVVDRVIADHGGTNGGYSYTVGFLTVVLTDALSALPSKEAEKLLDSMKSAVA